MLDIGTFDGFYAFLAEARGARRVVGVDNEQYVDWIRGRFGIELAARGRLRRHPRAAGLAGRLPAARRARRRRARRALRRRALLRDAASRQRPGRRPHAPWPACSSPAARSSSRPTARRSTTTRPRSRSTAPATSTPATTSSTGASRPKACAGSRGSPGCGSVEIVERGRRSTVTRGSSPCCERSRMSPGAQSRAGSSVVIASTPSRATRRASSASLIVPVVTLRPPSRSCVDERRSAAGSARRTRPSTPASRAQRRAWRARSRPRRSAVRGGRGARPPRMPPRGRR